MRFFTYNATDAKGQVTQGTIQASTSDEARLALLRAGWTVHSINPAGGATTPQTQPPAPQPRPAVQPNNTAPRPSGNPGQIILGQSTQTPPIQSSSPQAPAQRQSAAPPQAQQRPAARNQPAPAIRMTNPAAAPVINTKPGTDRDRFFLFSQLSAAFRAGLNPVQTFSEIAQRAKPNYKESLEALAKAAVEGGSLARTMARYPDLYPEHVVGMTEAGQQGGFLPDAFEQISLQAQSAHKFKRWFFWIWIVSINALLLIPGMWWAGKAMVATWDAIDASGGAGGSSGGTKSMLHAFWQILLWPVGPVFLLMSFAVWGMYTYFGSRRAKGFRHRLGLRFPIYGARARHENLSIFSWALARLSHSGIAPANAYRLAAYTAPNVEMRNELVTLASNLSGAEKMSDIVGRSKIFPEEYAPVIATAEYTGDLPNAFQQLADMNKSEFQLSETNAKLRSGCWGILAVLLAGVIGSGIFFHFYGDLQQHVLGDQGWLTPLR